MSADLSVLLITRKWGPRVGGMETWSQRFAEHLADRADVEVVALASQDREHGASLKDFVSFAASAAARLLWGPLPDVVHIGDLALWPLAALASLRRPTFVTVHGSDVAMASVHTPTGRAYRSYLLAARVGLANVHLMPNSRATADLLRQYELSPGPPVLLGANLADEPAGGPIPPVGHELVFAGRLMERKGLSWFVGEVLDRLPARFTLTVAGPHWDESEAACLDHPRVHYAGPLTSGELSRVRQGAFAVVVPNRSHVSPGATAFEGFGLAAVEAAADGTVVLASAIHGLRDAVSDGRSGLHLPPERPDDWIAAILEVDSWTVDERLQFTRRSMRHVREHLNWERYCDDVISTYEAHDVNTGAEDR